jgi:hypothetical protein
MAMKEVYPQSSRRMKGLHQAFGGILLHGSQDVLSYGDTLLNKPHLCIVSSTIIIDECKRCQSYLRQNTIFVKDMIEYDYPLF